MHADAMEVAGGKRKRAASSDAGAGDGTDCLSNLPDCLLHGILSQLRSRQAVQTCALSRRWRQLWRAVPCVDIDAADFLVQVDGNPTIVVSDPSDHETEAALARLEDFADSLLSRRSLSAALMTGSALDTLRLRIHRQDTGGPRSSTGTAMLSRWIRRGLRLSPAELDVTGDGGPIKLPSLFSSAGGRRITKLRLDNVLLHRDAEGLLGSGGLPALEDLELSNVLLLPGVSVIASDTLRTLTVVDASRQSGLRRRSIIGIVAPRLASLRLEFRLARLTTVSFTVDEASSSCLAHASLRVLDIGEPRQDDDDHDDDSDGDDSDGDELDQQDTRSLVSDLSRILGSLCNVTSLHLSGFDDMYEYEKMNMPSIYRHYNVAATELLQAVLYESCYIFPNLTSLVLHDCDLGNRLQSLWHFLHNTPALQCLALKSCEVPFAPSYKMPTTHVCKVSGIFHIWS
ncbi:hypothetical protein VPH35_080459 [Triticum aestivum]